MSAHKVGKFYRSKKVVSSETGEQCDALEHEARVSSSSGSNFLEETDLKTSPKPQGESKLSKCFLVPEALWKVFPRQQMAFEFSRNCYQNSAVFSFESKEFGLQGQRKYVVTTYYEFGKRYMSMKGGRHYYEVITEESACRLYFDVEFNRELNLQVDGISLLEIFIQYICYQMYTCFGLVSSRRDFLDLDSSTPHKFSRHLVLHLASSFRNNVIAGHFVHHCCDHLRSFKSWLESGVPIHEAYEKILPSPAKRKAVTGGCRKRVREVPVCPSAMELKSLFILDGHGKEVLLVDEGVYTRNRNFRLYLSSKLGKDTPLLVSKENLFRSSYIDSSSTRSRKFNTLMDSLVCNVSFDSCSQVLEFDGQSLGRKSISLKTVRDEGDKEGLKLSPFPLVDQFITATLSKGLIQGSIRRWTYFSQGKQLVYDIQHYRWCENVAREHKSNNIMIIADLARGVFYQKCHDPECKMANFKSSEKPIPTEFNPVTSRMFGSEQINSSLQSDMPDIKTLVGEISTQDLIEMEEGLLATESCTHATPPVDFEIETTSMEMKSKSMQWPNNSNQGTKKDWSSSSDDDDNVDQFLLKALDEYESSLPWRTLERTP